MPLSTKQIHIHTYTHIHTHTHAYTHIHTYTHKHTHTHIHIQTWSIYDIGILYSRKTITFGEFDIADLSSQSQEIHKKYKYTYNDLKIGTPIDKYNINIL